MISQYHSKTGLSMFKEYFSSTFGSSWNFIDVAALFLYFIGLILRLIPVESLTTLSVNTTLISTTTSTTTGTTIAAPSFTYTVDAYQVSR